VILRVLRGEKWVVRDSLKQVNFQRKSGYPKFLPKCEQPIFHILTKTVILSAKLFSI